MKMIIAALFLAQLSLSAAHAQDLGADGLAAAETRYALRLDSALSTGGRVGVEGALFRASTEHRLSPRVSIGLSLARSRLVYAFAEGAARPWEAVHRVSLELPVRMDVSGNLMLHARPTLRLRYEAGADQSQARQVGAVLGASWSVGEGLRIGPAVAVFTEIEGDGLSVNPGAVLDWEITDRLTLSSGLAREPGSHGGLALNYAVSDDLRLGIVGGYGTDRFRLNASGPVPGGIGEDRRLPIVATLDYDPAPGVSVSGFAGAALDGELRVEDASGTLVDQRRYDPAPLLGASIRFAF